MGSPTHPSPRLAMVMPSCVAPRNELRLAMMRRATFARRWPLIASASSCVSRIRTKANSAATKKPFNNTSPSASRILRAKSVALAVLVILNAGSFTPPCNGCRVTAVRKGKSNFLTAPVIEAPAALEMT